jgi:hypothetical protein
VTLCDNDFLLLNKCLLLGLPACQALELCSLL